MIRMLNDDYAKTLFELYLDSISSARDKSPRPGLPTGLGDGYAMRELELPEPGLQFSADKLYGSIRAFDDGEFLILYLIVAGEGEDLYTALKVSPFVEFITRAHLEFAAANGNYIAELDNAFSIPAAEIDQSVIIDEVDAFTFMQLENAWNAEGKGYTGLPAYRDSLPRWQYQFVAREHEVTTYFRSRGPAHLLRLWVPQLELGVLEAGKKLVARKEKRSMRYSDSELSMDLSQVEASMPERFFQQSREGLQEQISLLMEERRDIDSQIDRLREELRRMEEEFSLDIGNGGAVLLRLGSKWLGKAVKIFSDKYLVFKGEVPRELVLAKSSPLPPWELEQVLKLRIVPL